MFIYTVQPGDQLWRLAAAYRVTPESIIEANGLPNPDKLLIGQSLIIPTEEPVIKKTGIGVNGYIYFLNQKGVLTVVETGRYLTHLTPFSYLVTESGDLRSIDDEPLIRAAYENQIVPVMCIVNFDSEILGQEVAHGLLNSAEAIANLLSNILSVMRRKGYRGLNIDFEYVPPEDGESYNDFLPRNKIYFGFLIYAREWLLPHIQGQEAETFSCQEALLRAVEHNAVIQYDTVAQSTFFRYHDNQGRLHEVWFEDARSAQAKFDVVKEYGLAGISYWALGYPFPQNWTLLDYNFQII